MEDTGKGNFKELMGFFYDTLCHENDPQDII